MQDKGLIPIRFDSISCSREETSNIKFEYTKSKLNQKHASLANEDLQNSQLE